MASADASDFLAGLTEAGSVETMKIARELAVMPSVMERIEAITTGSVIVVVVVVDDVVCLSNNS